jgi:hypothetical protein
LRHQRERCCCRGQLQKTPSIHRGLTPYEI